MDTPWKRAKRHQKSIDQERELGKYPDSRTQPNSGRGSIKRDARMFGNFLVEARTTGSDSYSVGKKEFQSIEKQAIRQSPGCVPAMQPTINGLPLWVMRLSDMDAMYRELVALRGEVDELQEKLSG